MRYLLLLVVCLLALSFVQPLCIEKDLGEKLDLHESSSDPQSYFGFSSTFPDSNPVYGHKFGDIVILFRKQGEKDTISGYIWNSASSSTKNGIYFEASTTSNKYSMTKLVHYQKCNTNTPLRFLKEETEADSPKATSIEKDFCFYENGMGNPSVPMTLDLDSGFGGLYSTTKKGMGVYAFITEKNEASVFVLQQTYHFSDFFIFDRDTTRPFWGYKYHQDQDSQKAPEIDIKEFWYCEN
jgi:hypothetical protein